MTPHDIVRSALRKRIAVLRQKFDPSQPRDDGGRWTDSGTGDAVSSEPTGQSTDYPRALTGVELAAVDYYKRNGHAHINYSLRSGTENDLSDRQKEIISILDNIIQENKSEQDAVLYRAIDGKRAGDRYLKPNAVITDKAFMSTSEKESLASRAMRDAVPGKVTTETMLEIRVPKGTPAFNLQATTLRNPIGSLSQGDEKEWLLARGTAVKVLSVDAENRRAVVEIVHSGR